jgi:protein SSD1
VVRQDHYKVLVIPSFINMAPFTRSSRSAAKLAYQDAQNVIEGKALGGVPIIPEHDVGAIEHDIKVLESLAKQLRVQRFENGTLGLDSLRLSFKLDDNGLPVDCWQYERTDANELIEEVTACLRSIMMTC